MNFLNLVASVDQHAVIESENITDAIQMRPFAYGDAVQGKIKVVSETGTPTDPTTPVAIDGSMGVALTDGSTTVYANAVILEVTNTNELNFTLVVTSQELIDALSAATDDWVEAFFEARITKDGQDDLLLRQPVTINKCVSALGGLGPIPATVAKIILNTTIDHLRGDPVDDTSLENLSTLLPVPLPSLTFLIVSPGLDQAASYWQLLVGAADSGDPDGQVQPLDYNSVTNNRHWTKVGGL